MTAASPPAESPRSGEPGGHRLPRGSRIHEGREIRELMRRGKRKRTSHLDVFFAASPASVSRFGLVVPKHGNRIVDRNRLKRRLREIGRIEVLPRLGSAKVDLDVLVRARREAYQADFADLRSEMIRWVESRTCEPS